MLAAQHFGLHKQDLINLSRNAAHVAFDAGGREHILRLLINFEALTVSREILKKP